MKSGTLRICTYRLGSTKKAELSGSENWMKTVPITAGQYLRAARLHHSEFDQWMRIVDVSAAHSARLPDRLLQRATWMNEL